MTAPRLGSEPVRLAPVDLASAFAKPMPAGGGDPAPADRAAGLRSLALARPPAPPVTDPTGLRPGDSSQKQSPAGRHRGAREGENKVAAGGEAPAL